MTPYEIVAVVISSVGLLISIISIVRANNAHKIAQGQIELNIHQLLNQTKKDVMDVTLVIAEKCSGNDQEMKSVLTQALNTARTIILKSVNLLKIQTIKANLMLTPHLIKQY